MITKTKIKNFVSRLVLLLATVTGLQAGSREVVGEEGKQSSSPEIAAEQLLFAGIELPEEKSVHLFFYVQLQPKACVGFKYTGWIGANGERQIVVHSATFYRASRSSPPALNEVPMPQINVKHDESFEVVCPNAYSRPIHTFHVILNKADIVASLREGEVGDYCLGLPLYEFGKEAKLLTEVKSQIFHIKREADGVTFYFEKGNERTKVVPVKPRL